MGEEGRKWPSLLAHDELGLLEKGGPLIHMPGARELLQWEEKMEKLLDTLFRGDCGVQGGKLKGRPHMDGVTARS